MNAGAKFRQAVTEEKPLQVIGTVCAYHAVMAKRVGYRAIYLSGAGVAASSLGMARTDALASEGLDAAISRSVKYMEAGADMIFPEAITELAMYRKFAAAVKVPILANITEFGATPLLTVAQLRSADVAIALYPLSAFRSMNKAALDVYPTLRPEGTQKS